MTEIVNILDKPFLRKWYGTFGWAECEKKKKESGERGKALHADVEEAVIRYGVGLDDKPKNEFVDAAIRWCELTGFDPMGAERHVKSFLHRYGGTYDCKGKMPHCKKRVLVDWKFTGQIYDTNPLQGTGYAQAILETEGDEIEEFRVIRFYELKKPAKEDRIKKTRIGNRYAFKGLSVFIEEAIYTNLGFYFEEFKRCRGLWDYVNKKGAWDNASSV